MSLGSEEMIKIMGPQMDDEKINALTLTPACKRLTELLVTWSGDEEEEEPTDDDEEDDKGDEEDDNEGDGEVVVEV